MSKSKWASSAAKCPFYIYETADRVVCEGITRGSKLQLHFDDRGKASAYKSRHCNDVHGCKECEIAKVLLKKYR